MRARGQEELGAAALVQIESAAAERMAGTHYDDIVRVKQRSSSV